MAALAAGALLVATARPAEAASAYFANSIYSERTLSVTTINPARSGYIYGLGIGSGRYGVGIYAPMGCKTTYKRSTGSTWFQAIPGYWNMFGGTDHYVVIVNC